MNNKIKRLLLSLLIFSSVVCSNVFGMDKESSPSVEPLFPELGLNFEKADQEEVEGEGAFDEEEKQVTTIEDLLTGSLSDVISSIFEFMCDTTNGQSFVRDYFRMTQVNHFMRKQIHSYLPISENVAKILSEHNIMFNGCICMDRNSNNIIHLAVKEYIKVLKDVLNFVQDYRVRRFFKMQTLGKMINQKNGRGFTPLHIVQKVLEKGKGGSLEDIGQLLKKCGARSDIISGITDLDEQLIKACSRDDLRNVKELLKDPKINPNVQAKKGYLSSKHGYTALIWACMNDNLEIVKELLKHPDINPNAQDKDGETPLLYACWSGHLEIVKVLLKHPGININVQHEDGHTALIDACWRGHSEIVKELLKYPDVDIEIRTKMWPFGYTAETIAKIGTKTKIKSLFFGYTDKDIVKKEIENLIRCERNKRREKLEEDASRCSIM